MARLPLAKWKLTQAATNNLRELQRTVTGQHRQPFSESGIPLVDASRYLGHSSPSVTLNLYAHLLPGGLENTAKVMDALLTP